MRVVVFGGGHGAFATAGDLTLRGHDVILCELPELAGSIAPLADTRVLQVNALPATGLPSGQAVLAGLATDPHTALAGAKVGLLVVPSYAHVRFADFIGPAIRGDQVLLVTPGNLWGAARVARRIRRAGAPRGVLVGEAECMTYATRKTGPTTIAIRGFKEHLGISALDPSRCGELVDRLLPLYPTIRRLDNVIQTGLGNVNPFFHPPILLGNLGRMDGGPPFRFYADGVTQGVAGVIEALDGERLQVAGALGLQLTTLRELLLLWYGHEGAGGTTLHEVIHSVPGYQYSTSPATLGTTRYLLEDIPFGLALFARLAAQLGLKTPVADSLIALAKVVTGAKAGDLEPPGDIGEEELLREVMSASI